MNATSVTKLESASMAAVLDSLSIVSVVVVLDRATLELLVSSTVIAVYVFPDTVCEAALYSACVWHEAVLPDNVIVNELSNTLLVESTFVELIDNDTVLDSTERVVFAVVELIEIVPLLVIV
jgi:hypothetical protein